MGKSVVCRKKPHKYYAWAAAYPTDSIEPRSEPEELQGDAQLELAGSTIFNFSDVEDLGVKQSASLMLGALSKQVLDPDLADGAHMRRRF